jgi:ferrochelatase
VFTAHSLPVSTIEKGDRYVQEVEATARAVAERAGIAKYDHAYQSAGRTPEPWIGPDLGDLIQDLSRSGIRKVLVAPIGFVCDHTEILFDVDIQAAGLARTVETTLRRTESLNTLATFISALEDIVRRRL